MSVERAMADSVPTTGLASTNDTNEKATMAMEMDDASAFAMSLDALAESNPSDQLYDDLTRKSPKMQDNPQDHERKPNQAKTTTTSLATIKTEPQAKSPMMALASPSVPVRRSPRNHATSKTSTGSTKKTTSGTKRSNQNLPAFSWNDILHVQSLIERCLQQLLTKNDIVLTLQTQAKVDPAFTAVVWQKLEEQNPAFFRAYALQLQLKEQITAFNFLVSQQKEMMAKASGNAAFLSFLASSDARKNHRQNMLRTSRLTSVPQRKTNTPSPVDAAPFPTSSTTTSSAMEMVQSSVSQGFPLSSPLPLPSPMKTDLDTQAFFS